MWVKSRLTRINKIMRSVLLLALKGKNIGGKDITVLQSITNNSSRLSGIMALYKQKCHRQRSSLRRRSLFKSKKSRKPKNMLLTTKFHQIPSQLIKVKSTSSNQRLQSLRNLMLDTHHLKKSLRKKR